MRPKPFLTNFAVRRSSQITGPPMHYDEELDMNLPDTSDKVIHEKETQLMHLTTKTMTAVKAEAADTDKGGSDDFREEQNYEVFLATQTVTEVKNESADKDKQDDSSVFLATQTYTRTRNEQPDSDVR